MDIKQTIEYQTISNHYGNQRANRSQVLLINHIDEGLTILDLIVSSKDAKLAFCIHPLAQAYLDVEWSSVKNLAKEYAYFANKFLCNDSTDHIKTKEQLDIHLHYDIDYRMSVDCIDMLIADKIQNRKDFLKYHKGTHVRSNELHRYFDLWLYYLTEQKWLNIYGQ